MTSESDSRPTTNEDILLAIIIAFVLLFAIMALDNYHAGWRYRDLRDRLERLEQRP